jgi:hypothetical protein
MMRSNAMASWRGIGGDLDVVEPVPLQADTDAGESHAVASHRLDRVHLEQRDVVG